MSDTQELKEIEKYLGDIEWRLDNLYYIKDKYGKVIKFVRNESQMELWRNRHFLNIILKDRQRGFSTLIAILILDTCFFNSHQECGIIDISLPDGKKKLAKIHFAYERLPEELTAENPLVTDNKEALEWENGSTVYVGTSHRGGTLQILHISEAGKISARNPEKAREIRTGAMNTIAPGCWIFNESTAEGVGGEFYEDCQTAQQLERTGSRLTSLDYKFHFFGWWMGNHNELDPTGISFDSHEDRKYFDELEEEIGEKLSTRKRAWYVKKRAQQKDDMLREFPSTPEEAFKAAIEGAYLSKQLNFLYSNGRIGIVPHDPAVPVNSGWDFGISDHMTIWFHQRVGLQHRLIGYMAGTDDDVLYYWMQMQKLQYIWGKHFLPHDGAARRIGTAKSGEAPPQTIEDILNDAGMQNTEIVPRIEKKFTAIQEVRQFMPKCFFDEKECADGIKCLQNFKREWDEKMGCWKDRPLHNWAMHGYDGIETLIRGLGIYGDAVSNVSQRRSQVPPPNPYV